MFTQHLSIGSVYRIKFKSVFERHGVCSTAGMKCLHPGNGVFILDDIMTFRDVIAAGVKLHENFFAPVGIAEADTRKYFDGKPDDQFTTKFDIQDILTFEDRTVFNEETHENSKVTVAVKKRVFKESGTSVIARHVNDEINYAAYPIYKFTDVIDANDSIYVPELAIDGFPEVDIHEYKDLSLVLHLGLLDSPEVLDPMLVAIRDRAALYGLRADSIRLYCTGTKWMNTDEYEKVKTLRQPAIPVEITQNNQKLYLAERAIINNSIKRIVRDVNPKRTASEVSIDSLTTKEDYCIDDRLMLVECQPNDVYDPKLAYFEMLGDGIDKVKILGDSAQYKWAPGDNLLGISPVGQTDTYSQDKRYFTRLTNFVQVLPGNLRVGGRYYIYTGEATGADPESAASQVEQNYVEVSKDDIADAVESGWNLSPAGKDVYFQKITGKYNEVTSSVNASNFSEKKSAGLYSSDGTHYCAEVYATDSTLKIVGSTFKYVDSLQQNRSQELKLVDIIDIVDSETSYVKIPELIDNANNPQKTYNEKLYKKNFAGRRFKYTTGSGAQSQTFEVTLPDDLTTEYAGKSGVICGLKGSLSRTTMILNNDLTLRNYYVQYMLTNQQLEANRTATAEIQNAVQSIESERQNALERAIRAEKKLVPVQEELEDVKAERDNAQQENTKLKNQITTLSGQIGNVDDAPNGSTAASYNAQINYWKQEYDKLRYGSGSES